MALFPEQEWTHLVEVMLEWFRTDLYSDLTVKQCGEPSQVLKFVPDYVIANSVDVY